MNYASLLGRLLNEPDLASVDRWETSLAAPWAQGRGVWFWLALICAALVTLSVWFYLRRQPRGGRRTRLVLALVRGLLLSLIVLLLAEPILTCRLTSRPKPTLWVLFDGTDSMAIEDDLPPEQRQALDQALQGAVPTEPKSSTLPALPRDPAPSPDSDDPDNEIAGSPPSGTANQPGNDGSGSFDPARPGANSDQPSLSRMAFVQALLNRPQHNLLKKLSEQYHLRLFILDRPDGVRALDADWPENQPLDPAVIASRLQTPGQVTALGTALADLSRRHATSHLGGVVIVSDFDQNSGPSPLVAAEKLGVPLFTVGVGPTASVDLRVALQTDPKLKKAERKTIEVTLTHDGLEGRAVEVKLSAVGPVPDSMTEMPPSLVIGQQTITLSASTNVVQFPYVPLEAGEFTLVAEAAPLEGEVVTQNNTAQRQVTILDDFLRLMFVEYEPTWEWRFIKEVFHRDKLVGLRGFRTFLRSADPTVRQTNELFLPTLTPKRSDFFAHDVIFLGDMPANTLSNRFCEMVKEFVGKFGGGLVVLSGPRFGPGELAQTPLADLLPVVVDPDAQLRADQEFSLRLTPHAAQVDFMHLGATPAENAKAWDNLGPLPWYQPVARVHPLATVLAEHPEHTCVDGKTPQPLVAVRPYGRGEVVYLGFDETWRLRRRYGELYYRQFWGQMIYRLGLSHALGDQKRFVVQTDRQRYQPDDQVLVTVEAYDAEFEPLSAENLPDHQLTGELLLPGEGSTPGRAQRVRLPQRREGLFEVQLPADAAGEHRLRVQDPITGEMQEVRFQVASLSAERRSAVRNAALQKALAAETGGRSYELYQWDRLPEEIKIPRPLETSIRVIPLWNTWLVFVVFLGLLFGEWLVRKLVNLP